MHGARLDVYIEETVSPDGETEEMAQIIEDDSSIFDIEPEKNHDTISVEGLPKRVRFTMRRLIMRRFPVERIIGN